MIRIIDYGLGNIQAFLSVFKKLGLSAECARTTDQLLGTTHLILPGVGSFDNAMQLLNGSGMRPALEAMVLDKHIPVLGVCVGMQMLAAKSDEGRLPGLNWIPGKVCAFASHPKARSLPTPHMGWNDVVARSDDSLFLDFETSPRFYFLHSYYFECEQSEHVVATAEYGLNFDCVVSSGHIYGVQCHPEKSHRFGVQMLKNFAKL